MHKLELYAPLMIALVSGVLSTALPCIGPGDVDADSDVDAVDWSLMAPCLAGADHVSPPSSCTLENFEYADVERDGDVDLRDVAEFQNVYTDTYFDYGPWLEDKEAERVALSLSGELKAPLATYERAHRDLLAIRAKYPKFKSIVYRGRLAPRYLGVLPVDRHWGDVLQEMARYYQAEVKCCCGNPCGRTQWTLTFCGQLNMELMAARWEQLPEVEHAEPSGYYIIPECPHTNLLVDMPEHLLAYSFSCCDNSSCWRRWTIELDESNEIVFVTVCGPEQCVADCP